MLIWFQLTGRSQIEARAGGDDVVFTVAFLGLGVRTSCCYDLKMSVVGFRRPLAGSS